MSVYSKNSLAVREGRGELEFSESERIYGPTRPNMNNKGSRVLSADSGSRIRHRVSRPPQYNDYRSLPPRPGEKIVYENTRGRVAPQGSMGGRSRIYANRNVLYDYRQADLHTRTHEYQRDKSSDISGEHYYIRESVPGGETASVSDKEVETCCCGCVKIVESESCKGMNVLRCNCCTASDVEENRRGLVTNEERNEHQQLQEHQEVVRDKQEAFLMYRSKNYISEEEDEDESESSYAEIMESQRQFAPLVRASSAPSTINKRNVAIQMTTKYVAERPPSKKKLVRDVAVQTISTPKKTYVPPRPPSPPPPAPPRLPTPPPPEEKKPKYIGERPVIQKYKTAIIHMDDDTVDHEDIIVVPAKPPKVIEAPPRAPTPEPPPEPTPIYYANEDMTVEPLYDPLPLPLPKPKVEDKFVPLPLRVKIKPQKASVRVFAKGTTAIYRASPKPMGKTVMVRVGGGWMKVEHHRYRHLPLKVYEYPRDVNQDKFLYIRSKFMPSKKVPIAYRKYREEIVKP